MCISCLFRVNCYLFTALKNVNECHLSIRVLAIQWKDQTILVHYHPPSVFNNNTSEGHLNRFFVPTLEYLLILWGDSHCWK